MKAKLAIAGLLLFLATAGFFWYWQQGTKLSDTDTILIANFSNATGEPVLDGSLQEALAISLSQSPSLNLVSVEKVAEALRLCLETGCDALLERRRRRALTERRRGQGRCGARPRNGGQRSSRQVR